MTAWAAAQKFLRVDFRQEDRTGLPFPTPGDVLNTGLTEFLYLADSVESEPIE